MVPQGWDRTIRLRSLSYAATSLHLESALDTAPFEFDGAQGRDRTTDTAIFSRMLYQLSYLGMSRGRKPKRAAGL